MSKGCMEIRRVSLVTRWAKKVPAQGRVRVKALSWGVSDLVEEKFLKVKWAVCSFICESDVNFAKQPPFRSLGNICFTYCKNSTFRIRVYFTER